MEDHQLHNFFVSIFFLCNKAELLQEGIIFLIHLFARAILLMKKLEIEKTKPTFIISVLKVEYQVVLVSLISNFLTDKTALANKWMSFSSSNVALGSNLARFRICKIRKDGRKRNRKIIYSGG